MDKQGAAQEEKTYPMEYREDDDPGPDMDPWIARQMASAIKEIGETSKREIARNNAQQSRRVTELATQVELLKANVDDVRQSVAAVNSKFDTVIGQMEELIKGIISKKKKDKRGDFIIYLEEQGVPKISGISESY